MDELSEDDCRQNLCADLVSLTRLDPGLAYLFRQPAGTWVAVNQLYNLSAAPGDPAFPDLTATWLPSPPGCGSDCIVVVFFDADSLWSMIA
jgi:hypothetical protein